MCISDHYQADLSWGLVACLSLQVENRLRNCTLSLTSKLMLLFSWVSRLIYQKDQCGCIWVLFCEAWMVVRKLTFGRLWQTTLLLMTSKSNTSVYYITNTTPHLRLAHLAIALSASNVVLVLMLEVPCLMLSQQSTKHFWIALAQANLPTKVNRSHLLHLAEIIEFIAAKK